MNPLFGPGIGMPRPIRILLIANVAVFLADFLTRGAFLLPWMALTPYQITQDFQVWRLFTYMFVHDTTPPFLHILFNMLMLWMFGTAVVQEMGERRFWILYLLAGLFAGGCSLLFYAATGNPTVVIGSSGAIFALMTAYALFFPNQPFLMFFLFPVPAKYAVLIIGGIELLLITSGDRIAHAAHLGGALFALGWLKLNWEARALGFLGAWGDRQARRKQQKADRGSDHMRAAMENLDPILEKIGKQGMQSLTPDEKETLNRVSEMKRRQRGNEVSFEAYRKRKK